VPLCGTPSLFTVHYSLFTFKIPAGSRRFGFNPPCLIDSFAKKQQPLEKSERLLGFIVNAINTVFLVKSEE